MIARRRTSARMERRPPRRRSGFTLIELMVSVVIMTVGVLALASGSAGVLRQMRSGNQTALASYVVQARLETLRSLGCASMSTGNATTRGMTEGWTVTNANTKVATIVDSVVYTPRPGVTKTFKLTAYMPCQ
jgi:prepilin-type N-terminal cleavage/methylation domain-containing protein